MQPQYIKSRKFFFYKTEKNEKQLAGLIMKKFWLILFFLIFSEGDNAQARVVVFSGCHCRCLDQDNKPLVIEFNWDKEGPAPVDPLKMPSQIMPHWIKKDTPPGLLCYRQMYPKGRPSEKYPNIQYAHLGLYRDWKAWAEIMDGQSCKAFADQRNKESVPCTGIKTNKTPKHGFVYSAPCSPGILSDWLCLDPKLVTDDYTYEVTGKSVECSWMEPTPPVSP